MKEHFWESSAASLTVKKTKENVNQVENSFGSVSFQNKDEKMSVEFKRKSEFQEPTFDQSREQLEESHVNKQSTSSGTVFVDSHQKETSALRYEESIKKPEEKIFDHLNQLKQKIENQTLVEMLPENEQVQQKLFLQLKQTKEESTMDSWEEQVIVEVEKEVAIEDGTEEEEELSSWENIL